MRIKCFYYDGHYKDSGLLQEERDRLYEEAVLEDEKLTEWPDPDED